MSVRAEPWFRVYADLRGTHYHCRVFGGPGDGRRGKCGDIVLDEDDHATLAVIALGTDLLEVIDEVPEVAEVLERRRVERNGLADVDLSLQLLETVAEGVAAEEASGLGRVTDLLRTAVEDANDLRVALVEAVRFIGSRSTLLLEERLDAEQARVLRLADAALRVGVTS